MECPKETRAPPRCSPPPSLIIIIMANKKTLHLCHWEKLKRRINGQACLSTSHWHSPVLDINTMIEKMLIASKSETLLSWWDEIRTAALLLIKVHHIVCTLGPRHIITCIKSKSTFSEPRSVKLLKPLEPTETCESSESKLISSLELTKSWHSSKT